MLDIPQMPEEDTFDVESPEAAIDASFSKRQLDALEAIVRGDLQAAQSDRVEEDEVIRLCRQVYAMDEKDQIPYEGAPNITMPLAKTKVDGINAHTRAALDVKPFFVAEAHTKEGQQVAPTWEAKMEHVLRKSRSRREIFLALDEIPKTGTGWIGLSVAKEDEGDDFLYQLEALRYEDVYVHPTGVSSLKFASTFRHYREPYHVIRRKANMGIYDLEAVEKKMKNPGSISQKMSYEENRDMGNSNFYSDDMKVHPLWETYMRCPRFTDKQDGEHPYEGKFLRIVYSMEWQALLTVELSPYGDAIDGPPLVPLRGEPVTGYIYGQSVIKSLLSVQNMMDMAINTKLAYDAKATALPTIVNQNSPLYAMLNGKVIAPNAILPSLGNPREEVYQPELPPLNVTVEHLQIARAMGDDATYTDFQLQGIPISTRRTATEVRTSYNAGTLKLKRYLGNIRDDLGELATMIWALIYHFDIKPQGYVQVYGESDQYLLSARNHDPDEVSALVASVQMELGLMPEGVDPSMIPQQAQFFIAGAKRDDLSWNANGSEAVPDKEMRTQKLMDITREFYQLFRAAKMDKTAWNLSKKILESMEIHDWADLIGEEPQDDVDPMMMQQLLGGAQGG